MCSITLIELKTRESEGEMFENIVVYKFTKN